MGLFTAILPSGWWFPPSVEVSRERKSQNRLHSDQGEVLPRERGSSGEEPRAIHQSSKEEMRSPPHQRVMDLWNLLD